MTPARSIPSIRPAFTLTGEVVYMSLDWAIVQMGRFGEYLTAFSAVRSEGFPLEYWIECKPRRFSLLPDPELEAMPSTHAKLTEAIDAAHRIERARTRPELVDQPRKEDVF